MCFVSKLKSALKGGFFILYARLGDVETAENDSEKQKNYRVIVAHLLQEKSMQILHVLLGMRYRSSSMLKALMRRPNSVLQLPQVALYHIPKALSIGKTKRTRK
jgi:hypothetical protein